MQVKFFQPPVASVPELRTDIEPRRMQLGGNLGSEFRFGDFFGSKPGAGTGYYEETPQFVDAAEEVTTEQPTEEEMRQGAGANPLNAAQQKLVEQGELQYTDLGYTPQGLYSKPGTVEIAENPFTGTYTETYGGAPASTTTQTQTQTQTETETEDTGPTTRELIIQAEQWFLDNNVGLPYSRQDYGSDEDYLNALTGYIDTYVPPEEVVESTTETGTGTTETGTGTTTTTGTGTTTTEGTRLDELSAEQLREMGYLTQEEIAAMGYLTPEQMAEQGYMSQADFDAWVAEQAPGLVSDQVQNMLDQQDYESTMGELTTRLDELNKKYEDSQSQYDADAAKAQIDKTQGDIRNFFASSQPSGPRTGATSQFSKQPSFISGSANPMANLIKSQREGTGQKPYDYYYSSFTPSYSDFDEPISAEEYGKRSGPKTFDYPNPFTQGAANGGSVSNFQQPQQPSLLKHGGGIDQPSNNQGIGAALNFQTNVDPFQSAFRPNVKRR